MIKAIIDNRVVEVIEVKDYEFSENKDLVEIFFMNGNKKVGAIIPSSDIIDERTDIEKRVDELITTITDEYSVNISTEGCDDDSMWVFIDADTYIINVLVDKDKYNIDTLNKNKASSYQYDEDRYKNSASRKTLKGTLNHIKRFCN